MVTVMKKVVSAQSRLNLTGSEVWELTLACGHTLRRMKRARGSRHDKPAPSRARCHECTAVAEAALRR